MTYELPLSMASNNGQSKFKDAIHETEYEDETAPVPRVPRGNGL